MKITTFWAAAMLVGTFAFTACEKDDETKTSVPAEQAQQTTDNNDVKAENDQITSDATDALENFPAINGRVAEGQLVKPICGCSIDSSQLRNKQITLNFDGVTPCLSNPRRKRGGQIIMKLVQGDRWRDQGAKLQITLVNFKVTRESDQKFITFNGVKTITNVRGSRNWAGILAGTDSIEYKERGFGLTADLNGNGSHTYNLARRTFWRFIKRNGASQVRFRAQGDTAIGNVTGLDSWGTNRNNKAFTSAFVTPWVSDTYCGLGQPNSGKYEYKSNGNTVAVTAGVNQQGQPDTRDCAYGYKVSWNLVGNINGETVVSY